MSPHANNGIIDIIPRCIFNSKKQKFEKGLGVLPTKEGIYRKSFLYFYIYHHIHTNVQYICI